jgi:transcriptional regulator with XRE-family HTH domain
MGMSHRYYKPSVMSTGSLIRDARVVDGLTKAALARRLGITQPAIARLEAAGDEVTVATLQRALNAMGRALVLQAVQRPSSIDETLLHSTLALTPDQRLKRFKQWYDSMQAMRHDIIESRAQRAA